jgi:FKBP-type peptidyl-prolyl cis-trans isomerase FkpA
MLRLNKLKLPSHFLKFSLLLLVTTYFQACKDVNQGSKPQFSYNPLGYYYQLISFDSENTDSNHEKIAWLTASFKTQADSVFWDSYNNLNDHFFIKNDSLGISFLQQYVSKCSVFDSACLLIKTTTFFKQQFQSHAVPFFCEKDSVVKVYFKVKQILSQEDFVKLTYNLRKKEEEQIERYFGSFDKLELAADPLGFYWLEHTLKFNEDSPKKGDLVTISYKGYYLNGRFLESSGSNFEYIYGTPDQVLKGLNYVIGRLKLGENAKIVLPSRLAFGEFGSSNGTVPPYTPLVYEIQLINLKTDENAP